MPTRRWLFDFFCEDCGVITRFVPLYPVKEAFKWSENQVKCPLCMNPMELRQKIEQRESKDESDKAAEGA